MSQIHKNITTIARLWRLRPLYSGIFFIMPKRLTIEEFTQKALKKHGNKYDYSLVKYVNSTTKVKIVCPIHGVFEQKPNIHLDGSGCSECYGVRKHDTKSFINKAILVHGDKYDYSKTIYNRGRDKVIITCKIHGDFEQKAESHLMSVGCLLCGRDKTTLSGTYNTCLFIEKAKKIHGNRYDYSLVDYKHNKVKVKIICREHGVFEQYPAYHLNSSSGCYKCGINSISNFQRKYPSGWTISNWENKSRKSKNFYSFKVYIIKCWNDDESFYKIGRTYRTIKRRFYGKSTMPYNYEVLKEFIFDTAKEAFDYENKLKRENKEFKYIPNIHFKGINECFYKINFDL